MKEIQKCMLFVDATNQKATDYAGQLKNELIKLGVQITNDFRTTELAIVLGGDGTILKAKQLCLVYGIPLIGLNFGHKGFLMNKPESPAETARKIYQGEYGIHQFPLLTIKLDNEQEFCALNDFYLNRTGGKSCRANITVNGITVTKEIRGDGFIISTALGSTAYNFAAGGSSIHSTLSVISLTPICVYAPIQIRPMILPLDSLIEIEILNTDKQEIVGFYDGSELPKFRKIAVTAGKQYIKLAFWQGHSFTEKMVSKIMKAQEV